MLVVFVSSFVLCVAFELAEGRKIWLTEDYASACRRLDDARRRLVDAEEKASEKGDTKKNARAVSHARVAVADAERRRREMAIIARKWFTGATYSGALVVRAVYGDAAGWRLPFAVPDFARGLLGAGEDPRDINAATAFLLTTFVIRSVIGDFLDRRVRVADAYTSASRRTKELMNKTQ
ncbi:unnamed product [Ostreococcus tauri]|uniref:Unnamed product n=1 Tax=Ostreococcus tauri TaxID=70448 RepID=A0A098E6D9_OSTTA|nr:unnamed product [Ostreococcus tauri]CEG01744.1 unnamed product [Ostreococcus tauri]|eukprot:XP_022841145.1 unnamed product [Ostreococcus tauri]